MKLIDYIKDKAFDIILFIIIAPLIILILYACGINILIIILLMMIYMLYILVCHLHNYYKRRVFYNNFNKKLNLLDKKYLITEMIKDASFYDANKLLNYLYEIDKSFIEDLNKYKFSNEEFKEYIELWCHEIKTPIATSTLIIENNKNEVINSILEEIKRIDDYVEQVLFYARSGMVEKDYIITNVSLKKVVEKVIKRNKKDLLNKQVRINIFENDINVKSDIKWLEFIVNQIVVNSIKYSEDKANISFNYKFNKNNIVLVIKDNGIGIKADELANVFDKGFTGSNGRKKYSSTGIGLYLCKKLCLKLGHNIEITSVLTKGTTVSIIFPNNSLVEEIK